MKAKAKNGFTLIELMVTVAAASVLVATVALVLIMAFNSWRINNAFADLRRDAALAVEMMARDVRESAITDVSTAAGQLDLAVNPVRSDDISYTQAGDTLVYSTSGGDSLILIQENLLDFSASTSVAGDGVLLSLELQNADFNIGLTNQVFVNTRN